MATEVPQVLDAAKSPVAVMLVIVIGASPVLVRVRTCPVEVAPTMVLGKAVGAGARVASIIGTGIWK